ncbi:ABC transporter ATP-binding protein [Rhodobacter sp. NTK016B]|uniref:ABC transporter ATP-binding protein n=1 Tax=Rhodobacter sp. NTK016B TaxID=2759676 RepID=UPI001A8C6D0C|nr:ABC transporter ATP-binding protein [Rhodobacter sp. NTK016B]MBN8290989.1 ABC transporter ATP-binding protein [Rhodobacter sp. NTK016B]
MNEPALEARDLKVRTPDGLAVEGLDLILERGRTHCLVGESGCGKSLTSLAMAGLLAPGLSASGRLSLEGRPVSLPARRPPQGLAMIYQDATAALNPIQRIGPQVAEAMPRGTKRKAETLRLLARVGLPDPAAIARRYPHELSGGMNQRVTIAMALAARPSVLIADEPTTALDVSVQAQILTLLREVQDETGAALLFITHDLSVVAEIGDSLSVMYAGRIVETGPVARLFDAPRHPYTAALMACRPRLAPRNAGGFAGIPGRVPPVGARPAGCGFAPRCAHASSACHATRPVLDDDGVACLHPLPAFTDASERRSA